MLHDAGMSEIDLACMLQPQHCNNYSCMTSLPSLEEQSLLDYLMGNNGIMAESASNRVFQDNTVVEGGCVDPPKHN